MRTQDEIVEALFAMLDLFVDIGVMLDDEIQLLETLRTEWNAQQVTSE